MSEADAAELMRQVDKHPDAHRPTELDEETALAKLYGPADPDGIYRGEGDAQ